MAIPLTFPDLRTAYAGGVDPAEVVAQVYHRIAEVADDAIFIAPRPEAEVQAEAATLGSFDPDKPLWGVPFAVKDNIDVAGMPTTAACPAFAYTPEEDAFVVARLRAAGALVIGKTNLDQFATGLVGVRSPYGVPRNAIDADIVPGGSSAGSAVAVAQGIVSFALGTDTAGSGRVPAALNNIVGLKPTLGTWSARGCVPACRSVETISAFALTIADAYAVHQVATAFDHQDAYARRIPAPPVPPTPPAPTVGVPDAASLEFFGDEVQRASFQSALNLLRDAGAQVVELDFTPFYDIARMLYEGAWVAERYTVIEDLLKRDPDAIYPVTRQIITAAEKLSAADAFRGMYRLKELQRLAEPSLEGIDLLCVPTIPTFYSVAALEADPVTPNSRLGTYTNFVNLMDMCALAVPTPQRSDGRPGNVTLLARAGQDAVLAAIATGLEQAGKRTLGATGWALPQLSGGGVSGTVPPGMTPIVLCGAHMTGLPLNPQVTGRGGVFVRTATTAPDYHLYALPGGPPHRPGLVRGAPGAGAQIEVEVWWLPTSELGGFLTTIPSPLGLGRVTLADGTEEVGFLCEGHAVSAAEDITHLKSWRRFLSQGGT